MSWDYSLFFEEVGNTKVLPRGILNYVKSGKVFSHENYRATTIEKRNLPREFRGGVFIAYRYDFPVPVVSRKDSLLVVFDPLSGERLGEYDALNPDRVILAERKLKNMNTAYFEMV